MDHEPDDRGLVAAHLAGDPDAFGALFSRHRDRLWAVALRTTGDPEEAADALQDALVAAFRRLDSYRGDAAVTTWLHRIVVNACLDRMRRRKVRLADPLPDDVDEQADRGSPATASTVDPADVVTDHERRDLVMTALATLPAEQRAALVLVDMEGYSVEDTAAILDCAPGTVKSRCARGRARLAPLLAPLLSGLASGNPAAPSRVPPEEHQGGGGTGGAPTRTGPGADGGSNDGEEVTT